MRSMARNERRFWYALYVGKVDVVDSNGDKTGDKEFKYSAPVEFWAVLSPGRGVSGFGGSSYPDVYGADIDAERKLITTDLTLPVDETSLIWKSEPTTLEDGSADPSSADYSVASVPDDGLNFLTIRLKARAQDATV